MRYDGGGSSHIWRRRLENARSFIGNTMGGVSGRTNLASWVVAGTLAYFLWIKPAQQLKREQEEKAKTALAAPDPYRYVEKRRPVPDPQVEPIVIVLRRGKMLCALNIRATLAASALEKVGFSK